MVVGTNSAPGGIPRSGCGADGHFIQCKQSNCDTGQLGGQLGCATAQQHSCKEALRRGPPPARQLCSGPVVLAFGVSSQGDAGCSLQSLHTPWARGKPTEVWLAGESRLETLLGSIVKFEPSQPPGGLLNRWSSLWRLMAYITVTSGTPPFYFLFNASLF